MSYTELEVAENHSEPARESVAKGLEFDGCRSSKRSMKKASKEPEAKKQMNLDDFELIKVWNVATVNYSCL